jgi:hypothetical protein
MAEKQVTEARIRELIAEALKGFSTIKQISEQIESVTKELASKEDLKKSLDNCVSRDTLNSITSELITKDQWNEALETMLSPAIPLSGLCPELAVTETQSDLIPAEHLAGLTYRYADRFEDDNGDGGRTVRNAPKERELTPEDVLSWKESGSIISIVASDGQKHTVEKE